MTRDEQERRIGRIDDTIAAIRRGLMTGDEEALWRERERIARVQTDEDRQEAAR